MLSDVELYEVKDAMGINSHVLKVLNKSCATLTFCRVRLSNKPFKSMLTPPLITYQSHSATSNSWLSRQLLIHSSSSPPSESPTKPTASQEPTRNSKSLNVQLALLCPCCTSETNHTLMRIHLTYCTCMMLNYHTNVPGFYNIDI